MNGLNQPLYRRRISEIYVQLLFEYLEKLGHDPEKVLGESWPKADSNHLEGVDIDHWESLLIIAKNYLNDPFIGLHVGQTITAQHADIAQTFLKLLPDFRRQEILILIHLDAEL